MPFQSEKQRRYLWANEPEIARDWADTYGSRIESNTGGISRLGFANGPNWQVAEEDEDENPLEKFMRYIQGNAGNLSQADVNANTSFLRNNNIQFHQNNPYRMTSGPFQGMNAPGTSAHGSKNPKEMAQKWVKKYGGVDHKTPAMKEKKANIRMEAGLAPVENVHHSYSGGGISRLGYFTGALADTQGPAGGQAMSPGTSTTGGTRNIGGGGPGVYQDKIIQGGTGIKEEIKPSKKNWLGAGLEGLRHIGPFLGKNAPYIRGALSIYDMWDQPLKEEDLILSADDESGDQATSPGNYSQNEVANQLFGTSFNVLDPFQQGQVNDAINTYGTTSLGTIKT